MNVTLSVRLHLEEVFGWIWSKAIATCTGWTREQSYQPTVKYNLKSNKVAVFGEFLKQEFVKCICRWSKIHRKVDLLLISEKKRKLLWDLTPRYDIYCYCVSTRTTICASRSNIKRVLIKKKIRKQVSTWLWMQQRCVDDVCTEPVGIHGNCHNNLCLRVVPSSN